MLFNCNSSIRNRNYFQGTKSSILLTKKGTNEKQKKRKSNFTNNKSMINY